MKKIVGSSLVLASLIGFSSFGSVSHAEKIKEEEYTVLNEYTSKEAVSNSNLQEITQEDIVINGAGEWDPWPYNPDERYVTPGYTRTFATVTSGGGDYKVKLNVNAVGAPLKVELWESDGSSGVTYTQKYATLTNPGDYVVFTNLNSWANESDGRAEFFVNVKASSGVKDMVSLSYWD